MQELNTDQGSVYNLVQVKLEELRWEGNKKLQNRKIRIKVL